MEAIAKWLAILVAALVGLYWLRRDAKRDQRQANAKEVLNRVQDAEQVDKDIDRLNPDAKRERLRQRNGQ